MVFRVLTTYRMFVLKFHRNVLPPFPGTMNLVEVDDERNEVTLKKEAASYSETSEEISYTL
jgi:hypothetical protein